MAGFPTLADGRVDVDELRGSNGGVRQYWHPGFEDTWFPSVTNVAKLFDGQATGLSYWQRGLMADKWLEDPGFANRLVETGLEPGEVRKKLVAIPDQVAREAGSQGTYTHTLIEASLLGKRNQADTEAKIREDYADRPQVARTLLGKYTQAFKALAEIRAIPLAVEAVCYGTNPDIQFAGTIDLIADLHPTSPIYDRFKLDGNLQPLKAVIDFKTGKGVYGKEGVQVSAYMNATEFYATPQPLEWEHSRVVGLILHLKERSYQWRPVLAGPGWDAFQYCLGLYQARLGQEPLGNRVEFQ